MGKSKAFARIRDDILQIVSAIPPGNVTTFKEIGSYMTVMPRHVAYILSQLTPEEQEEIAWHRVVGESGKLGKTKYNARGQSQAELLQQETVAVHNGMVADFKNVFVPVAALKSGVAQGKNYSI